MPDPLNLTVNTGVGSRSETEWAAQACAAQTPLIPMLLCEASFYFAHLEETKCHLCEKP